MSLTCFHMNPRKAKAVPFLSSSNACRVHPGVDPYTSPLHFTVYAHPSGFSCAWHWPSESDQVSEQALTACSSLLHLLAYQWANAATNVSLLQWHCPHVCRQGLSRAGRKKGLITCCLSAAQGSAWKPQVFILLAGGNRMGENEVLRNPFSQSCCVCPNYLVILCAHSLGEK